MKTRGAFLLFQSTLCLVVIASAGRALAYSACVKKSGVVRIVLDGKPCKRKETPITLTSAKQVVDASGKDVGQAETTGDVTFALLQVAGTWVNLPVSSAGFVDTREASPLLEYFATSDCSGSAYVYVNNWVDESGASIGAPLLAGSYGYSVYVYNGILYYPSAPFASVAVQSSETFLDPTQPPVTACQSFPQYQVEAGTMATVNLSTLGFVPPFIIQ